MSLIKNTVKYFCIGYRRYSFDGQEGASLNCVEEYPNDPRGNTVGCSPAPFPMPFSEFEKIQGIKIGLFEPAIIEFVPITRQRQRSSVVEVEEILSITPFSEWSAQANAKKQNSGLSASANAVPNGTTASAQGKSV